MANIVLKSAFIAELIKGFDNLKEDFLGNVPDHTDKVGNNAIDMNEIGADPNVLIDNTVYPLSAAQREDEGRKVFLHKMETEVTIITDDELYALPYDKKGSVLDRHKVALRMAALKIALHSFAPAGDTTDTPVMQTTGATRSGRKMLTPSDIILFREKLDDLGVPQDGCNLVLCNEHVADLRMTDQVFEKQYHDIKSGRIGDLYGFTIFQNQYTVRFDASLAKVAYGAAKLSTHRNASVAFYAPNAMKARGDAKMYYSEAATQPRMKQSEVSFTLHFLSVPKKVTGFGALVSTPVG